MGKSSTHTHVFIKIFIMWKPSSEQANKIESKILVDNLMQWFYLVITSANY